MDLKLFDEAVPLRHEDLVPGTLVCSETGYITLVLKILDRGMHHTEAMALILTNHKVKPHVYGIAEGVVMILP